MEMKKFRIALLSTDDDLYDFFKKTAQEYGTRKCIATEVVQISSFKQFLPVQEENAILFVDDNFERRSSVEVARLIRSTNIMVPLVILSSSPDKVYDCFSVHAHRFFLKPITQTMVFDALDSYFKELSSYRVVIARVSGGYLSFPSEEICYLEAHEKTSILHTQKQAIESTNPYTQLATQLPEEFFVQIHRSYYVNMMHVQSFTAESVTLYNGVTLPVSRRRRTEFLTAYNTFVRSHTF